MSETFTCYVCRATYDKGWSADEAVVESMAIFGEAHPEDMAVVCDDCFKEIKPIMATEVLRRIYGPWTDEEKPWHEKRAAEFQRAACDPILDSLLERVFQQVWHRLVISGTVVIKLDVDDAQKHTNVLVEDT